MWLINLGVVGLNALQAEFSEWSWGHQAFPRMVVVVVVVVAERRIPWSNATPKTWSLVVASGAAVLGWILKRKEARISSRDDRIKRCRSWGAIVPVREERHAVVQFFNLLWFMA
jgi:hypothetical protein